MYIPAVFDVIWVDTNNQPHHSVTSIDVLSWDGLIAADEVKAAIEADYPTYEVSSLASVIFLGFGEARE